MSLISVVLFYMHFFIDVWGWTCEDGWTLFRTNKYSLNSLNGGRCYLAVNSPMSVPEAKQYCQDRVSNLLNLDHIDQLYHYPFAWSEQKVTIPQFILDSKYRPYIHCTLLKTLKKRFIEEQTVLS